MLNRWLPRELLEAQLDELKLPTGARLAYDNEKNPVALFSNEWSMNYFQETNPKLTLSMLAPVQEVDLS